jgi:hypothetical protein
MQEKFYGYFFRRVFGLETVAARGTFKARFDQIHWSLNDVIRGPSHRCVVGLEDFSVETILKTWVW